jgi:hypothetical protein
VNLLLHFAFFFSAHRFLAARLIFRLEAADSLRFDLAFFGLPATPPMNNFIAASIVFICCWYSS